MVTRKVFGVGQLAVCSYACPMPSPTACLIDVYETLLSCDFTALATELPALADISADPWNDAFHGLVPEIDDGRLSIGEAYAEVVRNCGREPTKNLVAELVDRDYELLAAHCRPYDDAIPFLEMLRDNGVATALVSNCADNTRPLLADFGLSDLVDALVLSCEVGSAKPSARIYQIALASLGVPAESAIFVDDQPAFCAGAAAVGIEARLISRNPATTSRQSDVPVVSSLLDLMATF